jgi:hypothetical protein
MPSSKSQTSNLKQKTQILTIKMEDGAKPRDLEKRTFQSANATLANRDGLATEARELKLIFSSIISKNQ